ncbi:MAG: BACON domain-containing protein [Bacteroidales bacterium]|nr:BACON domain-containing protein [Bacteroidales bacterium]
MHKDIFLYLAMLMMLVSCEDFSYPGVRPGNYSSLPGGKSISVDFAGLDTLRVSSEGIDTVFNVSSNTFWAIKGLSKVIDKETGESHEEEALWVTAPITVFEGDGSVNIKIGANTGRNTRKADIWFYTADSLISQRLPVVQVNNPENRKPIDLLFRFTDNSILNWPTSNSTGEYYYVLDGANYSFALGNSRVGDYLVVYTSGSYLGFPVVEDFKLTRVTVHVSSNNKNERHALVSANAIGTIVVGDTQDWPAKAGVDVVYDLHDTDYSQRYYLYCLGGGLPVAGITLHYEP